MHIDPDGRIKICCADTPSTIPVDSEGRPYNVTTHKLSDFWNSEYVRTVRKEFINGGQPKSCKECWKVELIGEKSSSVRIAAIGRISSHNYDYQKVIDDCDESGYVNNSPIDYQTMAGNLCNLGCKMCGPNNSTNFSKFFKSKGFETVKSIKFGNNLLQKGYNILEKSYGVTYDWPKTLGLSEIFSEYVDDIKQIFITGGEPTIVTENIDFLKELNTRPNANKITIQIATNCTNVNKTLLSSLENFKTVQFHCSIDGMDEIAAIQRTYSNWVYIEKNLKMLYKWASKKDNRRMYREMYFHSVITSLNLHHMAKFWDYVENTFNNVKYSFYATIEPPLGIEMIPLRFKNKLLSLFKNEDIKNYINSVNFSTNEEEFFQLLDFMQKLHPEYNIKEVYHFYYE
jgi:organic radical activating enzyme